MTFPVLPPAPVTRPRTGGILLDAKPAAAALQGAAVGTIVDAGGATLAAVSSGSSTLGILVQSDTKAFAKQGGLPRGEYSYDYPDKLYYMPLNVGDRLVMTFKGQLASGNIGQAYGTNGLTVDPALTTYTRKFKILEVVNGTIGDTNPRVLVELT